MARPKYPSDKAHNSARASEDVERKIVNMAIFHANKVGEGPPDMRDPQSVRLWARVWLAHYVQNSEQESNAVVAAKALLASSEHQISDETAKSLGASSALPQLASLPKSDRIRLLQAAIPRLQEELAKELATIEERPSGQPAALESDARSTDED